MSSRPQHPFTKNFFLHISVFLISICLINCTNQKENRRDLAHPEGQKLAQIHCQACHQVPSPEALDRSTWKNEVLPAMGLRLGILTEKSDLKEQLDSLGLFPSAPALEREEWLKILDFYLDNSPLFLESTAHPLNLDLTQFSANSYESKLSPLSSLVHIRGENLWVGNASKGTLHVFYQGQEIKTPYLLEGAPSSLLETEEGVYIHKHGKSNAS